MSAEQSFAAARREPPAHSFWYAALERRAGVGGLESYLVRAANQRGFFGAYELEPADASAASLSLEDIVVGLCAPRARIDGRAFKLIVRILQSGQIDTRHLLWLARKERAVDVIYWLLSLVPEEERTLPIVELEHACRRPRGYREPAYRYEPTRLLRRPFRGRR